MTQQTAQQNTQQITYQNADRPMAISTRRAWIENGSKKPFLGPAIILVAGGIITEVLTYDSFAALETHFLSLGPDWERTDFGDRLITPAFVNAHTHLAMNALRGVAADALTTPDLVGEVFFRFESRLTAEDVLAFAKLGAFESLACGTGFVWDHYYFGLAVAQAFQAVGLCGVVAPTLQDIGGPGLCDWKQTLADTISLSRSADFAAAKIFAALGPHATDTVSANGWTEIIKLAQQENIPVHTHLGQRAEEWQTLKGSLGCSPVEFLTKIGLFSHAPQSVLAHGIYVTHADLAQLAGQSACLVACPLSQTVFQFPADFLQWENAGIDWAVGTDCAASNDGMNLTRDLRLLAAMASLRTTHSPEYARFLAGAEQVESVFARLKSELSKSAAFSDPNFLLRKIFSTPGRLYPGAAVGQIQAGFLANLIVWDTDSPLFWPSTRPLRTICFGDVSPGAIYNCLVNGKWKGTSGSYLSSLTSSPAYQSALNEARIRFEQLHDRVQRSAKNPSTRH